MYLGVDIGATKTLVGVLDASGQVVEKVRFPTPVEYSDFLAELNKTIASFDNRTFEAAAMGIPVVVFDREHGVAVNFGNQIWHDVSVEADVQAIVQCPVIVENDAKVAGLSEALLVRAEFQRVLYIAIGTGIGYAFINNGVIDQNAGDAGGRNLLLERDGQLQPWETFASGKAIVERFGAITSDISDPAIWKIIAHDISLGMAELIGVFEQQVIVVGGNIASSFAHYCDFLAAELQTYELPLLTIPALRQAQQPKDAVLYGCYQLIRQALA
jgi:predicted NBD/HSP70 family sugar kinase